MDWEKIGLKCGIEIHQQLDSAHRLFCSCPCRFAEEEPVMTVSRRMRAVAGETGKIDEAALHEMIKGKSFEYKVYGGENCLVETDSEPPHSVDAEALETALMMSIMLKCEIPDELHVMRKTVIDGSNTSGFQRTLIAGLNGHLDTSFGKVGITNLCLEEDAAQILKRESGSVIYGLDRLGIPLVEIGTTPDVRKPGQARELAEKLGMLLRSTGRVKRGLGSIRQDINVSVRGGERVEIKGAQELRLISKLVEKEAERQLSLIKISRELRKKKFSGVKAKVTDVTPYFSDSASRIMKGKQVFAIVIPGFAGYLKRQLTETMTLGNEIAGYVKMRAGIKGIIHSDENLEKYRLDSEFGALRKKFGAHAGDTLIIMAAERKLAERTALALEERVNMLTDGVPKEVRKALENGDTSFLRPLPGAARMYPETDVPPIALTAEMLSSVEKKLPETWESKIKRISKKHGISTELSSQLVHAGSDTMFEKLAGRHDPKLVCTTLLSTFREMEREGFDVPSITENHLDELFSMVDKGRTGKEAVPGILRDISKNPGKTVSSLIKKAGMGSMPAEELGKMIRKIISEKKDLLKHPRREKVFMGLVMKEARGRVDGKTVMEALVKELKKHG